VIATLETSIKTLSYFSPSTPWFVVGSQSEPSSSNGVETLDVSEISAGFGTVAVPVLDTELLLASICELP